MGNGSFVNAGVIFRFAIRAHDQIVQRAVADRAPYQEEAIIAIVFAAASLEAFINELGAIAAHSARPAPESVRAFAERMAEAERSREQVEHKFHLAREIFCGSGYDKGREPFQSFSRLIKLRNEILHVELDSFEMASGGRRATLPPFIESLRSQNILADGRPSTETWLSMVMTRAAARWACNVAVQMVQSLLDVLPEGELGEMARMIGTPFAPVGGSAGD